MGMDWLIYVGYVALVALVVFLSIKLGKYVDVMDKKSNISGAFIGGVLLAAVTSLPELFTSVSSIWIVNENSMIIGNILGSDLINCAFFGVMLLVFFKGLKDARFQKYYYVALIVLLGMYGLVAVALYLGDYLKIAWYSGVSLAIFVLYALYVYKMPKAADGGESGEDKLTLKQAVVRFVICAAVLIGASIGMTYLTDMIAEKLRLGASFAGALFLGVATSLPELISSSTLCLRKNFDAAAGNIIGSNIFNFMILFVADMVSFMPGETDIYARNTDSVTLLVLGAAAALAMLSMRLVKNKKKQSVGTMLGVQTLNLTMPIMYVLYLLIATGVIVIPYLS